MSLIVGSDFIQHTAGSRKVQNPVQMPMHVQEVEARQWVSGWILCFQHKNIA